MSYKSPDYVKISRYLKVKEGDNCFRILSEPITGYEYWTTDNKPVRSPEQFSETPNLRKSQYGADIKFFWAFKVWNYDEKQVQVYEITQSSIIEGMKKFMDNPKWGNPREYDFIVEKKVEGDFTKYFVSTNPKEEMSEEIKQADKNTTVNLKALYTGGDPFVDKLTAAFTPENYPKEDITPDDIPF